MLSTGSAVDEDSAVGAIELLLQPSPGGRVTRIHSGSWIDSNYRIWIGQSEDNAAWTALYNWDVLDLYVDGKPQEPKKR